MNRYLAEFLATFTMIFLGTGLMVLRNSGNNAGFSFFMNSNDANRFTAERKDT